MDRYGHKIAICHLQNFGKQSLLRCRSRAANELLICEDDMQEKRFHFK